MQYSVLQIYLCHEFYRWSQLTYFSPNEHILKSQELQDTAAWQRPLDDTGQGVLHGVTRNYEVKYQDISKLLFTLLKFK